ncbi:hypothetical protein DVR12_00265 [Chitinophaga silvatica]|uniref:Uncharacterized protein n=1 Tax=Chitinophaga silvatica TaxID=2282649 RepID=A0A3E1YGD8_9BACT|nr:hypothetical protein [Chitinophaga silvatica]RFS26260.1 hypothetical protein DVR12_00265 [Chitinophaga silvatica]
MNKTGTSLPLITNRNFRLLTIFKLCALLLLCISFYMAYRGPRIGFLILLPIVFLLWNVNYVIKEYSIIGNIYLLPDEIVISHTSGIETKYVFKDLKNLQVFIGGVKGELYGEKAITTKTGVDNSLMFQYLGENKEIRFLLEDQQLFQLSQILQLWQQNGIKLKIHNQSREMLI